MGDKNGFLKYDREVPSKREVKNRIQDWKEIYIDFPEEKTLKQAGRCMDCGIPFCHSGCPLGNIIPDFNDAVHREDWKLAYSILSETNNFPEFTGRICPAPCEAACVLSINSDPVSIEHIEKSIIEKAFENGWVKPFQNIVKTDKKIAVVGSGPAGLAAADQLAKAGHSVVVYERNDKIGGLLRYGIPDFKLEKNVIDRRLEIMKRSGIEFRVNANVGGNISVAELKANYDAILLTGGSTIPRDLKIEGRQMSGVHFAMDYLEQKNREVSGNIKTGINRLSAKNKNVIVIGGGDTGADCVGSANRERAKQVVQLELLGKPPLQRTEQSPWPLWPMILRSSSSHEEGCEREWSVQTKAFVSDEQGNLEGLEICDIEWSNNERTGKHEFQEIKGSSRIIPCELALLAIGFVHPQKEGLLSDLGIELDERGNIKTDNYKTNISNIFAAGDINRGQSLVVWAISEGREAATEIDSYLREDKSILESKANSVFQLG